MSDYFYKGARQPFTQADLAAGFGFVTVPFDLSSSPTTLIDSIEYSVSADIADQPAVNILALSLFRNVVVNNARPLPEQTSPQSGVTTLWEARSQRINDFNLSREFGSPLILDTQFRYSFVGVISFNAAIAGIVRLDLFIAGRVRLPEKGGEFFGRVR